MGAADFSSGPVDDPSVPSMGVVKVIVAPPFTTVMAGYPGFAAPNKLYSPLLYDGNTVIGRSAPHIAGIPGPVPVGNLATPVAYPNFVSTPPDFINPLAPTREVFTEIRRMQLVSIGGSCSNRVVDPRLPSIPPGIPIVMAGPDGGAAAPALPRSLGQVQSKTPGANPANDFPARSFFDVFVEVNLPVVGSFPGATLRNSQPMVVTNQILTEFPPGVIYIHGATTAAPLVFKTAGVLTDITGANPTPYAAGQVFGWLVLAGHGTQIDCSSDTAVQGFINTVLGPPGNENPDLPLPGGNIVFVSDYNDPAVGFFPPGSGFTDSGFVTLLQNAGYNVIRYNQPNAQATLLTPAEVTALNTNDLVVISRCVNSGAFQVGQVTQWNAQITRPLIDLSAFHARNSRLGWFAGNEGVDTTPTALTPQNTVNPVTDYLFGGVAMSGTNMASLYDEAMDRNMTPIPSAPVAGGVVYASGTYSPENGAAVTTANFIVGLPAGTPVRGGVDISGGYRMFFCAGSRESATAPNGIPLYTSRENLSPAGEDIFLRAVKVALNNGAAPTTNTGPAGVSSQPASVTVLQGGTASFSVTATGEAPRLLIWQRDDGGGFTNIPGTESVMMISTLKFPVTGGAQFRVLVSNALNLVTSDVATLTVQSDTVPPVALSAASVDGNSITVRFDEAVGAGVTTDPGNYQIDGGTINVTTATIRADGRSVSLTLASPIGNTATLDVFGTVDTYGNFSSDVTSLTLTNYGLNGLDVGAVNPAGTNVAWDATSFQVSAGGLDVGSTADIMRLLHKPVTGDFDARVRVLSLVGTNDHHETTAKALFVARDGTANNAAGVRMFVTPPAPGDGDMTSSYRATTGGATNLLALPVPSGLPGNAWMRIRRVGPVVTTYRSINGIDWIALGGTNTSLPATLTVGVGVVSHRNGKVVTGTFGDFVVVPIPLPVMLTNSSPDPGAFSASFQSQAGFSYTVEFKDVLPGASWTPLTNIIGNGSLQNFTDPGPVSPTGNRFYRIGAQ